MPGFPVHHYLPEFAQTRVHSVCDCQPATSSSVAPLSMGFPRQEYWRGLPFHFLRTFLTQGLIWEALYGKVSQIYVCVHTHTHTHNFPGSSDGKESSCNAGDLSWIPGLGRSPGKGIGYRLQYSWASSVTQRVKNLHAVWESWVRSLGWEDPLEKGKATPSSILAWRIQWAEEPGRLQSMGLQRVRHD